MDDQRVPNLEEMDDHQAQHFLAELFSHLSPEEEYEIRHEDYTMEMPQSGERIRGREKMREFQEAYPDPPAMRGGLSSRMVCGSRRASRTTAGGRSSTSWPSWSCTTARCDGTPATTRSRSRRPSCGRGGSSRWNRRSQARPNSRGYPLSGGCTEVRRSTPPNETTRCLKARRRRHLGIILLSIEDVGRAGPIPVYKKD
jgi:hypothetical protein